MPTPKKKSKTAKTPAKTHTKPAVSARPSKSMACDGRCRLCGDTCMRDGLHEQHRCRDHVGMTV